MLTLTNEQRKCFALPPIESYWECLQLPSHNNLCTTFLYIDEDQAVKCIQVSDTQYYEFGLSEQVSRDRKQLLPKTEKGKPVALTVSNIIHRTQTGMRLFLGQKHIDLFNANTDCFYFHNYYLNDSICDLTGFADWVERWCCETTANDLADVLRFSQQARRRVRYREGDVFRFKIGRRLYGYGRILLNYDKMRKEKEPFWDILMGKPLVCSVYHIVTDRQDVSVDELVGLPSLPSTIIMDDSL